MVKLRPHLTVKLLTTMGFSAWHKYGTKDEDPGKAAREWSKEMDRATKKRPS